jgi:DNA polymerase III delta prime subunit
MKNEIWVEKYRPQKIEDCILPKTLKTTFHEIVKSGNVPNMILAGSAGTGKTTLAKALCKELSCDYIFINGSEESGIDVLRNKIKQFASSISLSGGTKVVIIDEAEYLGVHSTQPALRAFMEEFSNNCRFILTCNFKNRIIEPLHSRCTVVEFNVNKKTLASLAGKFMQRLQYILQSEGVSADDAVLAQLICKHAPDWRRVIGECQRHALSGSIGAHILADSGDDSFAVLRDSLKTKNFKTMREWVANSSNGDSTYVFRKIYDNMDSWIEPASKPAAVLILADYQYKSSFVADKEINLVACCTELMGTVNWK